jgi:hypothetical protein
MQAYLVEHALKNVWGNPEQDGQKAIAAKRITPQNGALNRFQLMNRKVDLPVKGKRYHVFNVGQLNPGLLGFKSNKPDWVTESWLNIADSVEQNAIMVSVYTADGTCIPLYQTYILFSDERALVIAVEENPRLKMDFKTDQVYFRVYSNAYYGTAIADQGNDFMRCRGRTAGQSSDILAMQSEVTALRQLPGYVTCYCNGFLVDELSPVTVQTGDSMEYIYDNSVKSVMTFDIGTLNTFNSELDSRMKFLLHYPGAGDSIDYHDDMDVYVIYPTAANRYKGYYYHRNTRESHRMVTHKDYSVVVDYLNYIVQKLNEDISSEPLNIQDFKIQLIVRRSGTQRPLVYDNSRVFEMYKLTDEKVLQAMVGVNATLPLWRAEALENNAYTELMRVPFAKDITLDMVQRAYGYNSISKIVGDTPQKTTLISGLQTVSLPEALAPNCTGYEYDENGYLLGWHPHVPDRTYQAVDGACRLVEAISGQGTNQPEVIFGTDNIPVPQYDNYRVYMCWFHEGLPNNQWRDVTGTSEYHIENGVLVWDNEQIDQFIMIRTDRKFLAYDIDVPFTNGNLYFTLSEYEDRGLGDGVQHYTLPVPSGDIDLFLNGKALIKGLDYIVKFPMVHVINKKYLEQQAWSTPQRFHVRMTGFCTSDLQFDQIEDFGFVEFGYLSRNNRHDIRDDKVLRITMAGATMHRDDLVFSEEHDGVSVADPTNGSPYQVKDIVVPLKELVNENTYSLRAKSMVIDQQVSNYMTIKKPEPDRGTLTVIPQKYPLVSPFVSRIVDAMLSGEITPIQIQTANTDNQVLALCQPFEGLLEFDPINEDLGFDYGYVAVHPHANTNVIALVLNQYRFLTKVVNLYARDLINLSPFFTVN